MRIWSFRRSFAGSEMERVSFDEWGNLGQALHEVLLEQVSPRQTGRGVPSEGSILAVCDPPRGFPQRSMARWDAAQGFEYL